MRGQLQDQTKTLIREYINHQTLPKVSQEPPQGEVAVIVI